MNFFMEFYNFCELSYKLTEAKVPEAELTDSLSPRRAYFTEELPWANGGGKGSVCIIHLPFLATL